MFGGPLTSLYYWGFFPCCQKEEDKSAREALNQINTVGARIIWHRDNRGMLVQNVKQAAFSWFGSKRNNNNNSGNNDNDDDSNNPIVKAVFRLKDNEDGLPEIRIAKRSTSMAAGDDNDLGEGDGDWEFPPLDEESAGGGAQKKNKKPDKNQQIEITLKRIHTVVPDPKENLIQLNILTDDGQKTKEWAKFGLDCQDQGATNMFVHNLQVLMEWDKVRRTECGELEYDETSAASSLKARAQKAAHFAKREIEMKQTKRSREERKAKYVQESGGLKYTALAMARNASASAAGGGS